MSASPSNVKQGRSTTRTYRLAVFSRISAALDGGYLVAYASAALLTVILPFSRINRAVTASLLSFVVWALVAVWAFAAGSAWRSWWPLLAAGSLMLLLALAFRDYGMRP